jgi:hypothetical protein
MTMMTIDDTLAALVAHVRAADPADGLPWLVLADRLEELGQPQAGRVRWWGQKRSALAAPIPFARAQGGYWLKLCGRIHQLGRQCGWLCRPFAVTACRVVFPAMLMPRHTLAVSAARTIRQTLPEAELYAVGVTGGSDVGRARSAITSLRDEFGSGAWGHVISAVEWCLSNPSRKRRTGSRIDPQLQALGVPVAEGAAKCLTDAKVYGRAMPSVRPGDDRLANVHVLQHLLSRFEAVAGEAESL